MNYSDAYDAILKDKKVFSSLPIELRQDKDFIYQCLGVKNFVIELKHISPELKSDKEFFRRLISLNSLSLVYAAPCLLEDKELIYASWVFDKNKKDPMIFDFLSDELKQRYQKNPEQLLEDYEKEQFKEKLDTSLPENTATAKKHKI